MRRKFLPIRTYLFLALLAFSYAGNCQVATEFNRITNVQDSYPVISPGGTYIMFQSNRTGNSEIFVTTIKGDSLRQLTFNAADDSSPIWSPDGNQIVFSSDRDGNPEIYIMQSDGSLQTRLTRFEGDDNHPHWSPDGKKIIFNSARTTADIKLPWGQQVHEIFIMNADGSDVRQISSFKSIATNPSISPDGKKIAFRLILSEKGFNWNLNSSTRNSEMFVMNSDGTNPYNISNSISYDSWPYWSPDGKKILFSSNRDSVKNTGQLFVVDADGSNLKRLTNGPNSFVRASWSPDGKKIIAQQVWGTDESNGNLVIFDVEKNIVPILNSKLNFRKIRGSDIVTDGGLSRGISSVDFNNDGRHDMTVANHGQQSWLYQNTSQGFFKKLMNESSPSIFDKTEGMFWADVDNDYDLDLLVTNIFKSRNLFFRNDSNKRYIPMQAGQLTTDISNSNAACWCDVDKDGDVDVFVVNRDGQDDAMYLNNGKGIFKSVEGPWTGNKGDGRACAWGDINNDGLPDLYVGNYMLQLNDKREKERNFFYQNQGELKFEEIKDGEFVNARTLTYGVSFADFDNDGDPDLLVTNVARTDHNILYENVGHGTFKPLDNEISGESFHPSKGHTWGDFNNDGYLDLFIVTGTEGVPDSTLHNLLYMNRRDGSFEKINAGQLVSEPDISAGAVWLDYNRDGNLDLFISNWGNSDEDNCLFVNETYGNNWIGFTFRGKSNNSFGLGVKVTISYTGNDRKEIKQVQWLYNSTGYASQNPYELHFGIGKTKHVDMIEITWPNGLTQIERNFTSNRLYEIAERQGQDMNK